MKLHRVPPSGHEDPLYPSSDGRPMAENTWQYRNAVHAFNVLRARYQHRRDVFVAGDLLIYYEEGKPAKRVAPDVFVAFGAAQGDRNIYKPWEEGKAPDFVLEVASKSTWREDAGPKRALYARLGVGEYWLCDPTGEFHAQPLQGLLLADGEYWPLPPRREKGQSVVRSRALGLDLRMEGDSLRFRDPESGEDLRTYEALEAERRRAETLRKQEANARQAAEARAAELEERLRQLETQRP